MVRRPRALRGYRFAGLNPVISGFVVAALVVGALVYVSLSLPTGGTTAASGSATRSDRADSATTDTPPPAGASGNDAKERRPTAKAGATRHKPAALRIDLASVRPDPHVAADDKGGGYAPGCHQYDDDTVQSCAFGDLRSDRVMALVGDSHAAQWQPALAVLARRHGWRLETYTKSACGFISADIAVEDASGPYRSCTAWNESLLEHLTGPDRPDLLVTSGSDNYRVMRGGKVLSNTAGDRRYVAGLRRSWEAVQQTGTPVAVIRNTPRMGFDVPACILAHPRALNRCALSKAEAMRRSANAQVRASTGLPGVQLVDLTDAICPAARCTPTVGNLIVWRDAHHLTATFARSLATRLDIAMRPSFDMAETALGYATAPS